MWSKDNIVKNVNITQSIPSIMGFKIRIKKKKIMPKALSLLIMFFIFINTIDHIVSADNSPPTLSKGTVTPRIGRPNIDYLFTVTYTDIDNDTPSSVKVFIDQLDYEMEELDPSDLNYTDGKEYFFEKVLEEGTYTIYCSADDGNENEVTTNSFTLSVTWDVGHYDIIHFIEDEVMPGIMLLLAIIFAMLIVFIIISVFMVLQMRKIAKGVEGKEDMGEGKEEGVVEDEQKSKID